MKQKYWVLSFGGIGEYEIVCGEEVYTNERENIHGPFENFREAKRWAIDGCKVDIETARHAIAELRSLKKKDCV